MIILGINDNHDSGAAIIKDGKIIAAINEERLNRIKMSYGMPVLAIKELLRMTNLTPEDIDAITIGTIFASYREQPAKHNEVESSSDVKRNRWLTSSTSKVLGPFFKTDLWSPTLKLILQTLYFPRFSLVRKWFKQNGFNCEVHFIDHHTSHAASAYYTSGKTRALNITLDGAGDTLSGSVWIGNSSNLKLLKKINEYNSIALWYSYVTELCGFTPIKHEGKITGLAAHGKPIYHKLFKKWIHYDGKGGFVNDSGSKHASARKNILKHCKDFKREDLAASIQKLIETEVPPFVEYWMKQTQCSDVTLSGGLFANVLLNQKIAEILGIKSVFIHPNMGDGGVAAGSALYFACQQEKRLPYLMQHAYLGCSFSEAEIEIELKNHKLKYKKSKTLEKDVAKLLVKEFVVARFNGAMEYGPRALGNRTILYQARDPTINDWLNKRLHRCYDEETEILTNQGWKFIKNISEKEVVATLNSSKNKLEFQKINKKISYDYNGEMFKIKNNRIDLLVTPKHHRHNPKYSQSAYWV